MANAPSELTLVSVVAKLIMLRIDGLTLSEMDDFVFRPQREELARDIIERVKRDTQPGEG